MSLRTRFERWRNPPADIVIISPLSPAECHRTLTGKAKARWYGDDLLKLLGLHGSMSTKHLSVRLPSHSISGDIEESEPGTLIRLSSSTGFRGARPVTEMTVVLTALAIPFVVHRLLQGDDVFGFLVFPALLLTLMWRNELKRRWPEYPANVHELAAMLAGHLDGNVIVTAREG